MKVFFLGRRDGITILIYALMALSLTLGLGCSTTHCRAKEIEAMKSNGANQNKTVKVFRYDGTLQCGMGKRIPLDQMAKELSEIPVSSSEHLNDGLLRVQLCGSPTGDANVYEIAEEHLERAKSLGFREWTFGKGTR